MRDEEKDMEMELLPLTRTRENSDGKEKEGYTLNYVDAVEEDEGYGTVLGLGEIMDHRKAKDFDEMEKKQNEEEAERKMRVTGSEKRRSPQEDDAPGAAPSHAEREVSSGIEHRGYVMNTPEAETGLLPT